MIQLGNRTLPDARETLARYDEFVAARRAQGLDLYSVADHDLGWRLLPLARHPRWPYATNRFGNRNSWPEAFEETEPERHVAILGNSHVHGNEAPDEETWVFQTQVKLGPGWRLHNLGVSAYATDQAILRLLDFLPGQRVDVAVLAITTTEMYRNLNQCRAFMMDDRDIPLFKPRFQVENGALRLVETPAKGERALATELDDPEVLALLRRHDAFYPFLATQLCDIGRRFRIPFTTIYERLYTPALELTVDLCRFFVASCRERGVVPAIMFLPVFWGSFPAGPEYARLEHEFSDEVPLLDARTVFTPERLSLPRDVLHHRANHFTALSAGWVSDHIASRLEDLTRRGSARGPVHANDRL